MLHGVRRDVASCVPLPAGLRACTGEATDRQPLPVIRHPSQKVVALGNAA